MGDYSQVTSVWPVLAIAAFVGIPALFSWLNSNQAKGHAKRGADEIEHQSQPNSGKSMTDKLDRIEAGVTDLSSRVAVLEQSAEKRGRRRMWRR